MSKKVDAAGGRAERSFSGPPGSVPHLSAPCAYWSLEDFKDTFRLSTILTITLLRDS